MSEWYRRTEASSVETTDELADSQLHLAVRMTNENLGKVRRTYFTSTQLPIRRPYDSPRVRSF